MVCLDTNVIVELLRGNQKVMALVREYETTEQVTTTAITEYELLCYPNAPKGKDVRRMLENIKAYDLDGRSARKSAEIFIQLQATGKLISDTDILIAGIAGSNGETLITLDKDFENIATGSIIVLPQSR